MGFLGRKIGSKKRKIGRYEVKGELGHGGMSTIIHAYDPRFRRDVAIKLLPWEFMHTSLRDRFEREAQAIALLEHPAIVPVYDIGEEHGRPYIVMRYMSGGSLSDRLRYGAIPVAEAVDMISRLSQALDAAHARGIVHRDVKPDNILFDQYGTVFLSDFGLARLKETGGFANISDGNILGTPAYMSPEQIQGKELDGRSDVYSLGVVFYHMITGIAPYTGNSVPSILMMHLINPVPKLLDVNKDLPPSFEKIIQTAMAKEQIFRFATAGEMAEAIEEAARDYFATHPPQPVETSVDAGGEPQEQKTTLVLPRTDEGVVAVTLEEPQKRFRFPSILPALSQIPVWSWLVGGAILFSVLSVAFLRGRSQPTAAALLNPPTSVILGGADKLAFLNSGDIWISNLDGSGLKRATQGEGIQNGIQWATDGQEILYISQQCIKSVDILPDGSDHFPTRDVTCLQGIQSLDGFAISPDGSNLAILLDRQDLYLIPYQRERLQGAHSPKELAGLTVCGAPYHSDGALKSIQWSAAGWRLALQYTASQSPSQDALRVVDFQKCSETPPIVQEISATYLMFTLSGYYQQPHISSFAWDGSRFILSGASTPNGWGELQIYNADLSNYQTLQPMGKSCCYRDARWSPDGSYLAFAYQPESGGDVQLIYAPVDAIDQAASFAPLPLPVNFFTELDASPQPALRPSRAGK
jgi:serine/threonine protein kinase